jgi:membrane-bound lytic murein transglycosylase F
MGIMPSTARRLGVETHELKRPEVGIRTGVECLRRFQQGFNSIEDHDEKIKFTLAAYNSGIGHIYDAQRLAEKYGKNPNVWDDNVAEYVRLKNEPEYYNDPVCRHGYLRGSETYKYVSEILTRYKSYVEKTR